MRIFVAGAAGVIGRQLLPLLASAGHDVMGTTRSQARTDLIARTGARPLVIDVYDRDNLNNTLAEFQPEVVIHQLTDLATFDLAANTRVRVEGTRNLVDAAIAAGARRVIAQSISWVCVAGEGLSTEEDPLDLNATGPRLTTIQGVQALETAVRDLPEWIVQRYGSLYGPGTALEKDSPRAQRAREGKLTANDAVTSFLHVEDAGRAAAAALAWPSGIYNIVDDEPASAKEWMPAFAAWVGAPPPELVTGSNPWERGASNAKARRAGWLPKYPTWRDTWK
ncbi:MAG: NAD(P)-dependent oxidoreductase [Dehalococcoidia bacterium]|nr:NAD(P)-dependent oxidoreductase [Dehalococcoidia bacterium]